MTIFEKEHHSSNKCLFFFSLVKVNYYRPLITVQKYEGKVVVIEHRYQGFLKKL